MNANKEFSIEKSHIEVLDICCFLLPEKTGEIVFIENDTMVSDALADTITNLSVAWGIGNSDGNL